MAIAENIVCFSSFEKALKLKKGAKLNKNGFEEIRYF